jgi:hypothetical protein
LWIRDRVRAKLIGRAFFYDRAPSLVTGRLGQESGTLLKLVQFKALFASRIVIVVNKFLGDKSEGFSGFGGERDACRLGQGEI